MDYPRLKQTLDYLYRTFDFRARIRSDPIRFPHNYREPGDIEVAGLIAASFAYGRVELFSPVIDQILEKMGPSPFEFLMNFSMKREGRYFSGLRYRFSSGDDIVAFIHILSQLLRRYGSIERAFAARYDRQDLRTAISGFVESVMSCNMPGSLGISRGVRHLFPSPERGGACKRFCLYLRWMVRDRDIDFGIWKAIRPSELVMPLDTHIARISRCLGLTARKTRDWKMAVEITEGLRILDPEDPLKYDFALCHQGIMGVCRRCDPCRPPSGCPILSPACMGNC